MKAMPSLRRRIYNLRQSAVLEGNKPNVTVSAESRIPSGLEMDDQLLKHIPEDSKISKSPPAPGKGNGLKRTISGVSLAVYFFANVYGGIPTLSLMYFIIQIKCFDEILKIGYSIKKAENIPFFRSLSWYFLIVANYFLIGETFFQHIQVYINKYYLLHILTSYYKFVSFCLYFVGLICFMIILRKKLIRQQFSLFFWTHFLFIVICVQTYMIIEVMFEGLIWLIMSSWLVNLNDIFAYLFGKYFGKTPLISLSPKKTVEGFIFGGLSTLVCGTIISHVFCHFNYLVCPIKYIEVNNTIIQFSNCTPSYLFQPIPYSLGNSGLSINYYPFIEHSFYLAIFASIIAPFGGFCASGFKRAARVKDFSNIFPGHGGFMDRCDCQFLMMTFINVYIRTFVKYPDTDKILQKVMKLSDNQKLEFYLLLKDSLGVRLMDTV